MATVRAILYEILEKLCGLLLASLECHRALASKIDIFKILRLPGTEISLCAYKKRFFDMIAKIKLFKFYSLLRLFYSYD